MYSSHYESLDVPLDYDYSNINVCDRIIIIALEVGFLMLFLLNSLSYCLYSSIVFFMIFYSHVNFELLQLHPQHSSRLKNEKMSFRTVLMSDIHECLLYV